MLVPIRFDVSCSMTLIRLKGVPTLHSNHTFDFDRRYHHAHSAATVDRCYMKVVRETDAQKIILSSD